MADPLVQGFLRASRELIALAVRSVESAQMDVTMAQFRLLALLDERGPSPIGRIAEGMGVNASNATRHVDRLQALDLVERRRSAADKRVVEASLTEAGRRVVDVVMSHRRDDVRRVLAAMPATERAAMLEALASFSEATRAVFDDGVLGAGW